MKEVLQGNTFEIISPTTGKREITFSKPFKDMEFDLWDATDTQVVLSKAGITLAILKYDGRTLSGRHVRGGTVVLSPQSNIKTKFENFFRKPRKVVLEHSLSFRQVPNVVKTSEFAVISQGTYEGVDNYKYTKFLLDDIDLFLKNGYNYVMVVDKPLQESSVKMLKNLTKYITGDVGSVQVVSMSTGPADELQEETGRWSCFAIDLKTWSKIRELVVRSKSNLGTSMSQAFKTKKLRRLSTVMSRDTEQTPQDANRRKFKEKDKG